MISLLQVQQTAPDVNKIIEGFTDDIKDPDAEPTKQESLKKSSSLTGSSLVHKSLIERKYLIDRKVRNKENDDAFYKL